MWDEVCSDQAFLFVLPQVSLIESCFLQSMLPFRGNRGGSTLKRRIYGLGVPMRKHRYNLALNPAERLLLTRNEDAVEKSHKKAKVAQIVDQEIQFESHFERENDEAQWNCVKCQQDNSCRICSQFMEANEPILENVRTKLKLCISEMSGITINRATVMSKNYVILDLSGYL